MSPAAVQLPSRKWSIVGWAALAALSVVVSYLLTIILALAFTILAALMLLNIGAHLSVWGVLLPLFFAVMGLTMLWSLIPRKDTFIPAGVLIDLSREPRLAHEIQSIASALGEEMPSEVYVSAEVNAGVAQRGGFMGFGSRRVMLLGLPLLQILSVAQFRSILAHEFAHFYAGDTRIGPWVFRARKSMATVLTNLSGKSTVLRLLTRFGIIALAYRIVIGGLVLYWKMFNRVTQYISRQQEFRCDELACHVAGSENFEQGMRNVNRAQAVFLPYWTTVVMPVTSTGHCPQLADGFARFMQAPHIAQAAEKFLQDQMANGTTNAMDTHPPLNQRIERARALAITVDCSDDQPVVSLIADLQSIELRLLQKLAPGLQTEKMKWTHWDSAGSEIYIPLWRKQTEVLHSRLQGKTLLDIPSVLQDLPEIANSMADPPGVLLTREQRLERAAQTITSVLTVALVDQGWSLRLQPGVLQVESGELNLQPSTVISQIRAGRMSPERWKEYCIKAGISEWRLVTFQNTLGLP